MTSYYVKFVYGEKRSWAMLSAITPDRAIRVRMLVLCLGSWKGSTTVTLGVFGSRRTVRTKCWEYLTCDGRASYSDVVAIPTAISCYRYRSASLYVLLSHLAPKRFTSLCSSMHFIISFQPTQSVLKRKTPSDNKYLHPNNSQSHKNQGPLRRKKPWRLNLEIFI